MRTANAADGKRLKGETWVKMKKYRFLYALILPAFVLTLIFCYLPMLGVVIAFQDYDIIAGIFGSRFVWFDNFIKIFTYPKFLYAIKNTVFYSAVILFCTTPFPILLALLFNELGNRHFKKVVQTISYLPYFLSWISVIGMFYAFFSTEGAFNDIRIMLMGADTERVNVLMDSKNFLPILFLSNLWKNVGWSSVIYLAAITGIDPTLYESATVDGCGRLKQVWYITLPGIMPTIIILFIMATGSLVTSNFEQVYGFQNVFTQEQTEVINTLVYRQGIQNAQYSLATAFGVVQGAVSFLIVFVSNAIIKRATGTGIW